MVCQAIGSAILTVEAITAYRPEVFFDTVGYAFGRDTHDACHPQLKTS